MIIYLDTETTGLYPGNICQLSYVLDSGNSVRAKNMFFAVDKVEYGAYLVHGFSVEKLQKLSGGQVFSDRIDEIEEDFLSADLIITHNIAFDFMFLRKEFENCEREFGCNNYYCSMKNMTAVCKLPRANGVGYKYPKLTELCQYFSIDSTEISNATKELFNSTVSFHDARFDTAAVYLAVKKGMESEDAMRGLKEFL